MSDQVPRLSIVVPTYNRAAVLGRAIASVLSQGFGDFELVVVDDGSTDGTRAVIESFADARIRRLEQSNMGVSAARNAGADVATGEFFVFLDSDDEFVSGALARIADRLCQHKLIVWGTLRASAEGSRRAVVPVRAQVRDARFSPLLAGGFAVRADLFRRIGGYDVHLRYSENTELAWRLRNHLDAGSIEVVEEPLAIIHTQSGRGHEREKYEAAIRILDRRSYAMEADGDRAKEREFRANYLGIAAVSAAQMGYRRRALALAARAVLTEPTVRARYRSALSTVLRVMFGNSDKNA
jgi:glycosyltransferase involved in cell wall biosynthesis